MLRLYKSKDLAREYLNNRDAEKVKFIEYNIYSGRTAYITDTGMIYNHFDYNITNYQNMIDQKKAVELTPNDPIVVNTCKKIDEEIARIESIKKKGGKIKIPRVGISRTN